MKHYLSVESPLPLKIPIITMEKIIKGSKDKIKIAPYLTVPVFSEII